MKFIVKVIERAEKTWEVEVEAPTAAAAQMAAYPVNPPQGPWDKTSCVTKVTRQVDGPWCWIRTHNSTVNTDSTRCICAVPRLGSSFTEFEMRTLLARGDKLGLERWYHHPAAVAWCHRDLTSEQLAELSAPLKSKSVADVLAGVKST